jgi:TonB family protein
MNTPKKFVGVVLLIAAMAVTAAAQRPRTIPADPGKNNKPMAAPQTVKAKYEGGVFGYKKKQEGTLSFDDANNRLVFRNNQQQEVLSIPYNSISQEFADTQSRRPKSATILGSVPVYGVPYGINPIGFIKTKNQYVTLQFYDPDSHAGGVTSFRVENKEICASIVNTLGEKAGLVQRGGIFVRQGPSSAEMTAQVDLPNRPAVAVENSALSGRVISLPRPVYPEEARRAKVTGLVRVLVTVDEKGDVVEAEAISGSPVLQAAAVDAAKQAKFEPVMSDGHPAKAKTVIAYNFVAN